MNLRRVTSEKQKKDLEIIITKLEKLIKAKDRRIQRFQNSLSWKITAPLRIAASLFSKPDLEKIKPRKPKETSYPLQIIPRNREWDWARRMKIVNHFSINVLFDIGANTGQYASVMRKLGYDQKIISFEPMTKEFSILKEKSSKDAQWIVNNYALGKEEKKGLINIASNSGSSSLLNMLPRHLEAAPNSKYIGQQEIEIKKLDSIFHSFIHEGDHVMIKIDTQGFEKEIIEGAIESIKKTRVIQLEMALVPLYENEMLMDAMIQLLDTKGFQLFSLENGFTDPMTGQLLQVDGIFINRNLMFN